MSFVPITGPATFRLAEPPRDSTVEFTDHRRTVCLPMRSALPVLTKARTADDAHPSVGLMAGAVLFAMRLVADGKFEPAPTGTSWQPVELDHADTERLELLAQSRAYADLDAAAAEGLCRRVVDAVVDAMPRTAPAGSSHTGPGIGSSRGSGPTRRPVPRRAGGERPDFHARLRARIDGPGGDDGLPQLVALSLRVEAAEEELIAGSVRLVLQVHDEQNPLHVCDAALLWTDDDHGFGHRARTHATIALRAAAEAWPVLERLQELRVPDQLTLEVDDLVSLLDDGVAALRAIGVDVLWPRSLGQDLTAQVVLDRRTPTKRDEPLTDGMFGPEALFAFNWRVSLRGDDLTDDEMDALASSASPIIRLRDNWMVVDPEIARKAKKRLVRTVKPVHALAAALTGVATLDAKDEKVVVGATLEKVRDQLRTAATREPVAPPVGLVATLRDYQLHGLTWLSELTSLGLGACLADDMGLGKTVTLIALHLHRVSTGSSTGSTLVVCPASLLGNWEAEIHRFAPGVPVRRFHGGARDLGGLDKLDRPGGELDRPGGELDRPGGELDRPGEAGGFVLTTYGTMRRDAAVLADVAWDLVVADEAQHVKNPSSSTARALRSIPSAARVALTGTPVENNLTELWAILDWATPGLLGSRNAFRKAWAAPIEAGVDPALARRFADLIGPFLLRRRKSDPGIAPELPAKTETDHLLGLTREQVVLYESLVRDSMDRIEKADDETRRGLVLKLLTGLKQICNHPAHYLKQANPRLTGRSEKLDLLEEVVGTVLAEGGAVLVFTQYVAMARLLEEHLSRAGIPHQFLHGGTPVREREAMVRRFQAGPDEGGVPVFLLSLKAGGTGLNLTRADHVVHFDRWWNPAVEEQATDRAYRIGQTRAVQVHRLVTEGTIEQRIAELLARKRSIADSVLAAGDTALTELSNAELRDLVTLQRPPG